jgi:peptidoglycan hydrolase CwlO-like protein
LRTRYYGYSDNLFEQLRSLNTRFGSFAADLVSKLEKEVVEGTNEVSDAADSVKSSVEAKTAAAKKPAAKKPAAKKPAAKKTTTASA